MLAALVLMRRRPAAFRRFDPIGTAALVLYLFGFSFAYLSLDASLGALVLVGGVQITMFAGALLKGTTVPRMHWIGAIIAFLSLLIIVPPGAAKPDLLGLGLMLVAALGWGIHSLHGTGSTDPLGSTAANFLFVCPAVVLFALAWPGSTPTLSGIFLAILARAITSGLGYALWYSVLPALGSTRAAVAQLTAHFALAKLLVFGGIAVSLRKPAP